MQCYALTKRTFIYYRVAIEEGILVMRKKSQSFPHCHCFHSICIDLVGFYFFDSNVMTYPIQLVKLERSGRSSNELSSLFHFYSISISLNLIPYDVNKDNLSIPCLCFLRCTWIFVKSKIVIRLCACVFWAICILPWNICNVPLFGVSRFCKLNH